MYRARNTVNRRACLYIYDKMENQEFIVFDTETTGLKPETDYIVEFSAQKFRIENHRAVLVEEIDIFIRPPFAMEQKIVDIHGISNEFLENKMMEDVMLGDIQNFFGDKPLVLGYNVDFDVAMLQAMYQRQGQTFRPFAVLDVLEMTRDVIYGKDVENYHLGEIVEMLGIGAGLTFHRAIDDVKATFRLLEYCCQEYRSNPVLAREKREHLYVNRIYFWKGFNKKQSGIYVETNLGKVYYSTFLKAWQSSSVKLEQMDIDTMEREVIQTLGISGSKELGKMTEKKFLAIKNTKKAAGVYL